MNCPKCDADISESYEPDDPSVGVVGGYYCDACDLPVGDDHEPRDDDVPVFTPRNLAKQLGTPISELSGRPGHKGFAEFCRIAKTWGYN